MVTRFEGEGDQPLKDSHLFTLRLWLEVLGNGQADWRGKVQHVNNGEARYFRDWSTLEAFLNAQLHPASPAIVAKALTGTLRRRKVTRKRH